MSRRFRPERSDSARTTSLSASHDLIQYVNGAPPTFKGSFANLTGATSNGYEAELEVSPARNWRGTASYTIVNPRVTEIDPGYQGSDKVGDALLRRPSHSAACVVSYAGRRALVLAPRSASSGKRADIDFAQFPSPRVTLPSYTKLDLSAESAHRFVEAGFAQRPGRERVRQALRGVLHFAAPGRTILIGARRRRYSRAMTC